MAVQSVYDTDCNGATVGSVIGAMKSCSGGIGEQWTKPINGTLRSDIFGMQEISVDDLVQSALKAIAG